MKLNSPLPQSLQKECAKAAKIFKSFVDNGNNGLDGVIPRHVLENAKGYAIFTIFKAGFIFSARAGSGIVIAKLDNGSWSAPSAIGTAGLGVGGQAGAEMTDFLVILNSRSAIKSFMAAGSLTLGGNMSIALGPLGRNGEAVGSLNTNGKVAAMYSYSKTRGFFGGVSVEGSVIVERQDANTQAYKSPVTARLLLGGMVEPPEWTSPLIKTLEACTGLPGNRQWVNDSPGPSAERPSYAFGGVASPGAGPSSPSFLKKKKKSEMSFPPASWGKSADTGSYFSNEAPQSHSRNKTWDAGDSSTANFNTHFESDFVQSHLGAQSRSPFSLDSDENGYSNPFYSSSSPGPKSHNSRANSMSASMFKSSSSAPVKFDSSPYSHFAQSNLNSEDDFLLDTGFSPQAQHITMPKPELDKSPIPAGSARAIALYDFRAVEDGDLSFSKGDIITIISKSDSNDDWWTGRVHSRTGIFPANFVEVI